MNPGCAFCKCASVRFSSATTPSNSAGRARTHHTTPHHPRCQLQRPKGRDKSEPKTAARRQGPGQKRPVMTDQQKEDEREDGSSCCNKRWVRGEEGETPRRKCARASASVPPAIPWAVAALHSVARVCLWSGALSGTIERGPRTLRLRALSGLRWEEQREDWQTGIQRTQGSRT